MTAENDWQLRPGGGQVSRSLGAGLKMVRVVKARIKKDLQSWDPKQRERPAAPLALMNHSRGEESHDTFEFPPLIPNTSHFPCIAHTDP